MLLQNKKGLVFGLANDYSIAWAIAQEARAQGAELGFTYLNVATEKRMRPLAKSLQASLILPCDVASDEQIAQVFQEVERTWGKVDFLVHSIAFARKEELEGRYVDTSREGFRIALDTSAFSLVALARAAAPLMKEGGSILTLSYYGAEKVVKNYNVMGVAKAALEASVRYLAADLGEQKIRVNAISAGPIKTLAFAGINDGRYILKWNELNSPLKRNITQEEVGNTALYLLSDLGTGMTGEIMHVDGGYHVVGMINTSSAKQISELLANFEGE